MIITTRICRTAEETFRAGRDLAQEVREGDVVLMVGDLGSGKTTFVQGLVYGYGLFDPVTSPTFNIVHVYGPPDRRVIHADLYRLSGMHELETVGLLDDVDDRAVMVIEWPERLGGATPRDHYRVLLQVLDCDERYLTIERNGGGREHNG